ncbi:hypothetical protein PilKf_01290 [Pillotina sp. SPG140]|jgi:hypothetical protein
MIENNIFVCFILFNEIDKIEIYPKNIRELLKQMDKGVKHFVYKEH